MNHGAVAERKAQKCLRLGALLFVPSYSNPGIFVAPGGIVFTKHSLQDKGAEVVVDYLWQRSAQREAA